MRWFKHFSNASDDDFLEELEEQFGLEGYARWWKLLEIIAKEMDKTEKCYSVHSWTKWQTFLKGKRNKLETFLVAIELRGKIKLEVNGNILKIICPKLLELRDEYSRKSGDTMDNTPDSVAVKKQKQKAEADRETKAEAPLPPNPTDAQPTAVTAPLATHSPPALPGEKINLNDFAACCACLLALLRWPRLSPPDQEIAAVWCQNYDIRKQVLPVVEAKLNANLLNKGKPINSLKYFTKAIDERYSGIASDLGKKMRSV